MFVSLIVAAVMAPAEPVDLSRVFQKDEKLAYDVSAHLLIEEQVYGSPTFMPDEVDLNYSFTEAVKELKPDGIAVIHYQRPTMTIVEGETAERPPKKNVEKTNFDMLLTISPVNEFIDIKDLAKKGPANKGKAGAKSVVGNLCAMTSGAAQVELGAALGQFIQDLVRMSAFVGSVDSSVDFSPKLPLTPVKPGATWKKTVGYQPQLLKGTEGKSAVQRLDYTYTYGGVVDSGGKKVHRVTAVLHLDTDAAAWFNQVAGAKASETHLKSIPLKLDATIDYDLDLNTRRTLKAVAGSKGSVAIEITDIVGEPVMQLRLTGKTLMKLKSAK